MRLLVTGVCGQLGHDVVNELISRGHIAIGSDIQSVYSGVAENAVLKISACSLHSPKTLEVYNGKTLQGKQNISTNLSTVNIPVTLNQGKNVILLNVPEGTERPCDFPELKNNDTRALSIAIQGVELIDSSAN